MKKLAATLFAATMLALSGPAMAADLTIWGLQSFNPKADQLLGEMAKKFGAERGIDVEYVVVPGNVMNERLAAAFEGKAAPDVFAQVGQQAQYYAGLNLTEPLDDVVAKMRAQQGGIYEGAMPQSMYQGQAHAVPLEIDVFPMFVRTDLLKEAGLEIPKTWDELRIAAEAIVKANPQITGFGLTLSNSNDAEMQLRILVWSFGGAMFSEDGKTATWNSAETVAAYQYIADLFASGVIPKSTLTWDDAGNNTAYQTGRAAFIMNPPSVYSWMKDNDPDLLADSAMVESPKGPGEKGRAASMLSSFMWLVNKSSARKDDAKAWLDYFYQPGNYEGLIDVTGGRWMPVYPSMTKSMPLFAETPAFQAFDAMAQNGVVDGYKGTPSVASAAVYQAKIVTQSVQKMLVDGATPQAAADWAQSEIEKILQK